MATDKETEKLRKQIDVLSSLIYSHKQLKEKEIATKNNTWNITHSKSNLSSNSSTFSKHGKAKLSPSFSLDRRKRQLIYEQRKSGSTTIPSPTRKTKLFKDDERSKAEVPSKKSENLKNRSSGTYVVPQDVTTIVNSSYNGNATQTKSVKLSTEAALLAARLSSLSHCIASTRSKIKASNDAKNLRTLKSECYSRTMSEPERLKTLSATPAIIPSTSGLKWSKEQPTNNKPLKVNSKNLGTTSKSSEFTWSKMNSKQLKSQSMKLNSVPAAKSTLKWNKEGLSRDKNTAVAAVSAGSRNKHVWRSKGSVKIDRQKSNSVGSSSSFMKRRQKVVQKINSKKNASSRYHFVNPNKKKFSGRESISKMKRIEGVVYRTSANKLEKQSQVVGKSPSKNSKPKSSKLLNISGNKYLVNASRKTLKRVHPTINQPSTSKNTALTPSKKRLSMSKAVRISLGGFVKSIPGRKTIASQMRSRSVQNALLYKYKKKAKSNQFCMFYNRFGKCNKGDACPYIHDPTKIAVCTKFLKGKCDKTDGSCPFSHKIDKDKMPVCQFFLKDMCTKEDCPYSHVNVSSNAEVCEDFVKGYCPLGQKCKKKHIVDCEEFLNTRKCLKGKKCNLIHRVLKPRKRRRKSSAKDEQTTVAKAKKIVMTEEEGFLPLESSNDSTEKESITTRPEFEAKEKALSIKPRFLLNKDIQDNQG